MQKFLTDMDEKHKSEQKSDQQNSDLTDAKISAVPSPNNNNNNNSELSNSSISNVSTSENSELLHDMNCNEKSKRKSNIGGVNNKDGPGIPEKTKNSLVNSNVAESTVKEDGNILVNVKKEESSLSPISPVGFDSISNAEANSGCNMTTGMSSQKGNSSEKSSSPNNTNSVCKEEINTNSSNSNSTNSNVNVSSMGNAVHNNQQQNSSSFGGGGGNTTNPSPFSNCLEYMQQQNHIFVFSTQLANKGAESVLSGQYQTIIAYHCTQPSTKSFLEEFLMKNPMKMSKFPRSMLAMGGGNHMGNQFATGHGANAAGSLGSSCGAPAAKSGSRATANNSKAMNFNLLNATIDQKQAPGRAGPGPGIANSTGFSEGNENDSNELMQCWENNRALVPGDLKIGDNLETSHHLTTTANKNTTLNNDSTKLSLGGNNDQIPSLQGVKVPDENLTPQQRQHREEQLAKLKKMNQFLFPENESSQATPQSMSKIQIDNGSAANLNNLMMNLNNQPSSVPGGAGGGGGGGGGGLNPMNSTLRNNLIAANQKQSSSMCESGNMNVLVGGGAVNGEQINTENGMASLQNKTTTSINCETLNSNLMNLNMPGSTMPPGPGVGVSQTSSNMIVTNETNNGAFSQCGGGGGGGGNNDEKIISNTGGILASPQDIASIDWPKMQNQFVDERMKGGKIPSDVGAVNRLNISSNSGCGGNSLRPNPTTTATGANNASNVQRNSQGPPPPYHSTQRSASVPIATQSPNPSSPNNPTSNLSLPSPASTGGNIPTGGVTLRNSPNLGDMGNMTNVPSSSSSANSSSVQTQNSSSGGQLNKVGGGFPREGTSPLNNNNNINTHNTNPNRNSRNNSHNQLNTCSNPSTPLSHMSPKDLDVFNANNGPGGDSLQTSIDNRFPSPNPAFNFPPHIQNSSGNPSNFKPQLDRQNSSSSSNPSFGRRPPPTDNLPLNPNTSRAQQNKLGGGAHFDPISSLAQMSQQLTSCVSSGVGNSPNIACNELNMPSNMGGLGHQSVDGVLQSIDGNLIEGGGGGNMPHITSPLNGGSGNGMFGSNNCNINPLMMGSMNPQHRLINPKMCNATGGGPSNGFNTCGGSNNNAGNFHSVLPPPPPNHHHHRLRMPGNMNFNNFNMSPNIQVKASTPNTIQYMPVRPQNNNNMRAPPSLDFLQRYANPSHGGGGVGVGAPIDNHGGGGGGGGGNHLGQINSIGLQGSPDNNKMMNNIQSGMNFFQHCNQTEPDEMGSGSGGLLPTNSHDVNVGMIRNLRPMMRQQHNISGVHGGNVPHQRMIAPNNSGPIMQYPPGNHPQNLNQESLDCGADVTSLFGSGHPNANASQHFHMSGGGSHKTGKSSGGGGGMLMGAGSSLCSSLSGNGTSIMSHEHNGMPSSINPTSMGGGPQLPIVSAGPNPSNINYKSFVGPASNDLKYAQQYHSFQQQLYATSTRNQHPNLNSISSVTTNAQNSNTPFFVNK